MNDVERVEDAIDWRVQELRINKNLSQFKRQEYRNRIRNDLKWLSEFAPKSIRLVFDYEDIW